MSEEALIKMIYGAASNAALKSGLLSAITPEQKATVAMKHGYEVNAEDFESLVLHDDRVSKSGEISDADLAAVGGGRLDGISALIAVTQMKAENVNDEALQAAVNAATKVARSSGGSAVRRKH